MPQKDRLKQQIMMSINQIPEQKVQDVLQYIQFLVYQQTLGFQEVSPVEKQIVSDNDPIKEFIGGVEHGALATDIDEAVYG